MRERYGCIQLLAWEFAYCGSTSLLNERADQERSDENNRSGKCCYIDETYCRDQEQCSKASTTSGFESLYIG